MQLHIVWVKVTSCQKWYLRHLYLKPRHWLYLASSSSWAFKSLCLNWKSSDMPQRKRPPTVDPVFSFYSSLHLSCSVLCLIVSPITFTKWLLSWTLCLWSSSLSGRNHREKDTSLKGRFIRKMTLAQFFVNISFSHFPVAMLWGHKGDQSKHDLYLCNSQSVSGILGILPVSACII